MRSTTEILKESTTIELSFRVNELLEELKQNEKHYRLCDYLATRGRLQALRTELDNIPLFNSANAILGYKQIN